MSISLVLALLLGASGTASATSADAPTAGDNVAKPRKICRPGMATGSRLGVKRICMTEAEWDTQARLAQESVDTRRANAAHMQTPKGRE